jgi:HK97 family phage major capsid protein
MSVIDETKDDATEREGAERGLTMTYSQSVNRIAEIEARMSELAAVRSTTPEQEAEFDELRDEVFALNDHRKRLERADKLAQVKSVKGQVDVSVRHYQSRGLLRTERGSAGSSQAHGDDYDRDAIMEPDSVEDCRFRDPWNLSEVRTWGRDPEHIATEYRARALSAIERMSGTKDSVRQAATKILERFDDEVGRLSQQCLVTSSPAYLRAWAKMARNRSHSLTQDERRALQEAEHFRAMSLTDSAGGYLVPFQLDPTIILTSDGSANDIRMFARQVVATGDKWNGVTSAAVSWSWDAEAAEVSDDAPAFGQPEIPIYKAQGFVPISIEALQDEQNVTATVAELLARGKDDLEGVSLITGSGSGQCTGIVTALAASSPTVVVNAATDDTFALKDVYAVFGALAKRYRNRASWLSNNLIYQLVRQFDTAGGAGLWTTLGDGTPEKLLGRPVGEAEAMDGSITTSGSVHNYAMIVGDFENYVIADRIGMTVEFIPMLFHTSNNRPSGQRGWYAYARMGADSVNDKGLRMLDVVSAS